MMRARKQEHKRKRKTKQQQKASIARQPNFYLVRKPVATHVDSSQQERKHNEKQKHNYSTYVRKKTNTWYVPKY